MSKFIRRRWKIIIILCFIVGISGGYFIHNVVMADSNDFYLYYINDSANVKISEYTIERKDMVIHLKNDETGIKASDIITWNVEDENVLTVVPYPTTPTSATIICNKPGKSKVFATIKRPIEGGDYEIFSAECIFTVRLAINDYVNTPSNQDKIVHLFDEDPEDCGSLVIDVGDTFDFKLKIGEAKAEDLSWTSLDKNIATIDESGKVTAIQPGIAKILVQTYELSNVDNVLQSDYIYVIVKPKFKNEDGDTVNTLTVTNPTVLETNISDYVSTDDDIEVRTASEFAWIVKDESNNVVVNTYTGQVTKDAKGKEIVSLKPSKVDGTVRISCISGEYTVEVYPVYNKTVKFSVIDKMNYSPSKAKITENVELNVLTESDYVQVHDVWDLYAASNIDDIAANFDITTENCEYSKEKGTITFSKEGLVQIRLKRKATSSLPLDVPFSGEVLDIYLKVKPYSAKVSNVRVAKGGEETISVSDYGYDSSQYGIAYQYEFVTNNKAIATVYSNTVNTAIVSGVKEGTTTVDCVVSYINGIRRKLTWNVTVWKKISATLDATEKFVEVGNQIYINAKYPEGTLPSDINIEWRIKEGGVGYSKLKFASTNINNSSSISLEGVAIGKPIAVELFDLNAGEELATCYVTVVDNTKINFKKSDYSIVMQNEQSQLDMSAELIYTPNTPLNPKVEWTSKDTTVATVSNSGLVTAKKAGYTTITATYYVTDKKTVTASCLVYVYQKINKITLTKTQLTINNGEEIPLTAIFSPEEYILKEDKTLTWSSDNMGVARATTMTTSSVASIKAVSPGKTTITVTAPGGAKATCEVTVIQLPTGVSFADKSITMSVGDAKSLTAVLTPLNVTDTSLTYTSSFPEYLTVDKTGKATAVSAGDIGKVTVNVDVATSNGFRATLAVTIVQHVDDMQLNYDKKTVAKGTTFSLVPTITPANAYNKKVTYTSSDSKVATVSASGVVKGINGGVALISCKSEDTGLVRYTLVVVEEKVTSISLSSTSYILGLNKTHTLKATVTSNFASNTKVKWTTSNSKIVTVSQKGVIKGLKLGYATITATAQDGSGVKATCRVRVIRQTTSLTLNKASAEIVVGSSLKLKATVKPSNATLKSISWSSSDESIAYVDAVGKVIAVKEGRCVITATAKDGSGKNASCIVQVIKDNPITGITIVNKDITLVVGESEKMNSFVAPKRATDSVKWYSDDSRVVSVNKTTGLIKARRTGKANITLASTSGKSTTTSVTVVGLNRSSLTMEQYDTYQLRVVNGKSVQWDSSNQNIVRVTNGGKISARKTGTSYITALVNGRRIKCKVKVTKIK